MSEPTPEPTPTPDPTPTDPPAPPDLGDAGKKALAEERAAKKAAEKRAADAEARIKEFEDKDKSEAEKAAARADAAEARATKAETEALRLKIGVELGLPADMHEFLTGSDEESLRGQAAKLAEKLAAATAGQPPRKPQPDPSQGARPDGSQPPQITRAELAGMDSEAIVKAKSEGRLNEVLGIK